EESPGAKEARPEKEEGVRADTRKGGLAQATRKADLQAVARGRQGREGSEEGAQGNRKALWRRAETAEGRSQAPHETRGRTGASGRGRLRRDQDRRRGGLQGT